MADTLDTLESIEPALRRLRSTLEREADEALHAANAAAAALDDRERERAWYLRATRLTALAGVDILLDETLRRRGALAAP